MLRLRKSLYLFFTILFVFSCSKEEDFGGERNAYSLKLTVEQARDVFEQTVSDPNFNWPENKDAMNFFLNPGHFTPNWKKAKVSTDKYVESVDVEILPDYFYSGVFSMKLPDADQEYLSHVTQKLLIVRDKASDKYSCYVMSIIPSHEYNTVYGDFSGLRFHNTSLDKEFGGKVIYSTLGVAYAVRVDNYENGTVVECASMFDKTRDTLENLQAMNDLFGQATLSRSSAIKTRSAEGWHGGTLDEVVVTPPSGGGYFPPIIIWPPVYYPPSDPYPTDPNPGGGGGGGGYGGNPKPPKQPDPPTPNPESNNPCNNLNDYWGKDSQFISRMKQLKNLSNNLPGDSEREYSGMYYKDDKGVLQYSENNAEMNGDRVSVPIPKNSNVLLLIHTHPLGTSPMSSVFSLTDIYGIFKLTHQDKKANMDNYMLGVITNQGATYMLSISNKEQFVEYGNTHFQNFGTFNQEEGEFIDYIESASYTIVDREGQFIKFLSERKTGLQLHKGDVNSFTSWERKDYDNSNKKVINDPCK